MSASISARMQLNYEVAKAKRDFGMRLFMAIGWAVSTTIMWIAYAIFPSPLIVAAILFTVLAIMHSLRAIAGYFVYAEACEKKARVIRK